MRASSRAYTVGAMASTEETRLWHPFADMGAVRENELVIERGDDVWVWDEDDNRYLDATASLWYSNVGHGRPEIAAAVAEQFKKLETYSAFGDFVTPVARELASTLADLAPMDARIFLTTGGGESIDTAAKIARRYWSAIGQPDRTLLISRTAGYHGTNGFGTALAGIPANRDGFGPQVETVQVPHDSLEALQAAIEKAGAERVAAVFAEPVIGAGGVYPPMPGYLEGLAALCKRTGVLFIADAVICAFGRLGTWFGVERFGVQPDMITFAKGVTSGYLPLGGVVASARVAEPFWQAPGGPMLRHGATYAAHAACCAAALANIDLLGRDGLLNRGQEMESVLHGALKPLADSGKVSEVRGGVGTMAAVELSDELLAARPGAVGELVAAARGEGVLVRGLGRGVAVSPPLTATAEHFGLIHDAISHGLSGF
jgi:putrescine---pyruvate transaminase